MRLYIYAAIAASIIAVAGALYFAGQHNARQAEELRQADEYRNTRDRIDDALQNSRADGAGWIERLRRATE